MHADGAARAFPREASRPVSTPEGGAHSTCFAMRLRRTRPRDATHVRRCARRAAGSLTEKASGGASRGAASVGVRRLWCCAQDCAARATRRARGDAGHPDRLEVDERAARRRLRDHATAARRRTAISRVRGCALRGGVRARCPPQRRRRNSFRLASQRGVCHMRAQQARTDEVLLDMLREKTGTTSSTGRRQRTALAAKRAARHRARGAVGRLVQLW